MSRKKPQSAMAALLDFAQTTVAEPIIENPEIEKPRIFSTEKKWHDVTAIENTPVVETRSNMQATLLHINPEDCIVWRFSDRPSDELGDIDALAQSLKEHGQQEPILVRHNRQDTAHAYEVIFGNRRWRAAQIAKIKLIAICKDLTDQQAALCQKEENENRKELSDYARAMSYRAQLDGGVFKNESELSKVLGISKQALNDLMAYLRVPEPLREAISNYKSLSKKMVTKLASLSKDKDMLDVLMLLSPKISDQSVTTANLEKHIQSYLTPGVKRNPFVNAELQACDAEGKLLYKTRLQNNGEMTVQIARSVVHTQQMENLHQQFASFLKGFMNY
jgi:ParB family chromosome partitioning protein